MKIVPFLLLISLCSTLSAKTYYVAPTGGTDTNPGTKIQPWATWQKAFDSAKAGDTVFFRGGTWYPVSHASGWNITHLANKYGTYSNPICFFNYPGEKPVLDCRNVKPFGGGINGGGNIGVGLTKCGYIHIKGLEIKNVWQRLPSVGEREIDVNGFDLFDCTVIRLENMSVNHCGGAGYFMRSYDTLRVINCDAYFNCDTLSSDPGNHSDGMWIQDGGGNNPAYFHRYTLLDGCRSWHNGDDGFDLSCYKTVIIRNCWSWDQGWVGNERTGEGNGWKFCQTYLKTTLARQVYNCISAENRRMFADVNLNDLDGFILARFFNNTSYKDEYLYTSASAGVSAYDPCAKPGYDTIFFSNNLAYAHTGLGGPVHFKTCENKAFPDFIYHVTNSWIGNPSASTQGGTSTNKAFSISNDDFLSLDKSQLLLPRKPDGSLPEITFMKLKDGSDLIDAGMDVGMGYNGSAPDLGAFEYHKQMSSENLYPHVKIISPNSHKIFEKENILLEAEAFDKDGSITKVEFYYGNKKAGESTTYPWSYIWNTAPPGKHSLRAVAYDEHGAKTTSSIILITVIPSFKGNENSGIIYPNPSDGIITFFLKAPLESICDLLILSADGKIIHDEKFFPDELIKRIDISRFKAGLYILMLKSRDILLVNKFIKK